MTSESLPIISESNGENKFPRLGLVLPGSVPGMIVGVAYLIEVSGHQWNIHGDAILVMGLVFLSATIAFVFEAFSLHKAIGRLRAIPTDRTPLNYLCTGLAFAFVICVLLFIGWFIKMAATT